ncbi:hypothetical protein ON010_g1028 [Phytophthora cinnamomi]|nr:hypothetical protein ON010_g1028 [Phytophthora cinnamomi]
MKRNTAAGTRRRRKIARALAAATTLGSGNPEAPTSARQRRGKSHTDPGEMELMPQWLERNERTSEEIEQAIPDNERINATPAGPEEPTAKTRRQGRRMAKRYNLNKAFQALNVTITAATVTMVESHVATGNTSDEPPPVRREEPLRSRRRDAERMRARRALLIESDRERTCNEELARREGQSENERQAAQGVDRLRQQQRRRQETPDERHALTNQEDFRVSMLSGPNIVNGRHRLPPTTVRPHCSAWKWPAESKKGCCLEGAVQLPPLPAAPPRLHQLYTDAEFRRRIRAYNQVFAFTSIGASCSNRYNFRDVNQDESVAGQRGVYTYRIQGAMGHYLGSLLPRIDRFTNEPMPPKFAQIYIVDPDMQQRAERRRGIFADLDSGTLLEIEQMMEECNPFAQQYLNFAEKLRADQAAGKEVVDMVFRLHEKRSNPRTHNLPTVSEVGATLIEDGNLDSPRDILLCAKDHSLLRLFETHSVYDPLQYPLLLPHGELGWTYTDVYANNVVRRKKREMSLREHVAYRLFQKVGDESVLHQGGRLFQQYCVDQRAKCEQEQLRWVASHQAELRADQYSGVRDALLSENTAVLREGEALLTEYNRETGALQHPDEPQRRSGHFLDQPSARIWNYTIAQSALLPLWISLSPTKTIAMMLLAARRLLELQT